MPIITIYSNCSYYIFKMHNNLFSHMQNSIDMHLSGQNYHTIYKEFYYIIVYYQYFFGKIVWWNAPELISFPDVFAWKFLNIKSLATALLFSIECTDFAPNGFYIPITFIGWLFGSSLVTNGRWVRFPNISHRISFRCLLNSVKYGPNTLNMYLFATVLQLSFS